MKKTFLILLGAMLAISHAHAQFVQGPIVNSAVTNVQATSGATGVVFQVPMITTTNLTEGQKKVIYLNGGAFSFSANVGITNSTATTNCTFRFEFTVDGTNYGTSFRPTFTLTPGNKDMTNFPIDLVRNYKAVRLYSIQNTNALDASSLTNTLYITNMVFGVR